MIEWITVSGPSGYQWLPFAKKQARFMMEFGTRPAKFLRMNDGTEIYIRVDGDEAHIRIVSSGDGALYQFWGAEGHLYKDYLDTSYPDLPTRYIPRGHGVSVTLKQGNFVAKPLGSNLLESGVNAWAYSENPLNVDSFMPVTPSHQPDGLGLRYRYRRPGESTTEYALLGSAWAPSHPCHGFGVQGSGGKFTTYLTDTWYDYQAVLYRSKTGDRMAPPINFWRSACVRVVAGREFVIMVDAAHNFAAFPSDAAGPFFDVGKPGSLPNVPLDACQVVPCPWPGWVNLPDWTVEPFDLDLLQPQWEFHPNGERAACIVGNRSEVWEDSDYTSTFYNPDGSFSYSPREDTPGLVEISFDLEVNGDDFSFSISLVQSINGATDRRQPVAVAYACIDLPDDSGNAGAVPYGSLIILEYRHYWSRYVLPKVGDWHPITMPPRATVAEITVNGGVVRRWLAYYGCYPTIAGSSADEHPFYPRLHEFPEVGGAATSVSWNHFCYTGQICSLDLSTLSVCIGAAIWTSGIVGWHQKGAEGVELCVYAYNTESASTAVGHPLLKQVVADMLRMGGAYPPSIDNMEPFYACTTISAVEVAPPDTGRTSSWTLSARRSEVNYAHLTIDHNDGSPATYPIYDAAEGLDPDDTGLQYFYNIRNCGLFPDSTDVFGPRPFSWIDQYCIVRPGIAWFKGTERQPGEMTYTGYPFGAIHHESVHNLTMSSLSPIYTRFSVEPKAKSWAVFCGPVAAHPGMMTDTAGTDYEQSLIDIIVIKDKKSVEHRTGHRAMLNAAFGLNIAEDDYYFVVREGDYGLEMQPQSDDPTPHPWYGVQLVTPLGVCWGVEAMIDGRLVRDSVFSSALFDSRYGTYSGALTFPSPKMEGVFWNGR